MFKALLIVYILGGGGSIKVDNTYNTNFVFQEFYSMADCNTAEKEMKDLLTWKRGDGEGEDKDMISVLYSTKCVPMAATGPITTAQPPEVQQLIIPASTEPIEHRKHSRWDD